MKTYFFLITSLLFPFTNFGMSCPPSNEMTLFNQSGQDVFLRIRSGEGETLKVFTPPVKDQLKINQEAFTFPNNTYLKIDKTALNDPIRIRTWPTSYTPSVDVDQQGRPIETSEENVNKAGPSIIPSKADIGLGQKLITDDDDQTLSWEYATQEDMKKKYKQSYRLMGSKYTRK